MAAAGVKVRHLPCRGQIHTSLTAVDMILSGAGARAEISAAIRQFFHQVETASADPVSVEQSLAS